MRDDAAFKERETDRDIAVYREYLHGQVRELLTDYGKIDVMWFDFSYPDRWWGGKGKDDWGSEELLAMTRELQPGILVNDRLEIGGDLVTPEQYQPARPPERDGEPVLWEACQTLNGSWGYDRDNLDWKSLEMLVRMLVDTVSKGGNLLLNVGPTARGEFDPRALDRLRGLGEWMRLHGRAIRGCTAERRTAASGLPLHPARRPPLPPRVRLAVPARPPRGPRRPRHARRGCSTTARRSRCA